MRPRLVQWLGRLKGRGAGELAWLPVRQQRAQHWCGARSLLEGRGLAAQWIQVASQQGDT